MSEEAAQAGAACNRLARTRLSSECDHVDVVEGALVSECDYVDVVEGALVSECDYVDVVEGLLFGSVTTCA
jgi:hypothetical protein